METADSPEPLDPAELTSIIAEISGTNRAEIERRAEDFFQESPEEADWEYID